MNYDVYGISLNVRHVDDYYIIGGDYAVNTYLGDKFDELVDNIKYELGFVGNYESDVISCCLSESQMGVYLDEKVNDMGTAYSASGVFECPEGKSVDEIEDAIHRVIDKHPILKGRIIGDEDPLLVCDAYPSIEISDSNDYSELIKAFDLILNYN